MTGYTRKATAHVYSPPFRPPRSERERVRQRRAGRPTSTTDALSIIAPSRHLVLGEDLLDALEGLVDRHLRLLALLRHGGHRHALHLVGANYARDQHVDVVDRRRRA